MKNKKLKVGDRVKIIDASMIEDYELGKIGTIIKVQTYDFYNRYTVDMGRSRRSSEEETCWYVRDNAIELANEGGQLLFPFMSAMGGT